MGWRRKRTADSETGGGVRSIVMTEIKCPKCGRKHGNEIDGILEIKCKCKTYFYVFAKPAEKIEKALVKSGKSFYRLYTEKVEYVHFST